MPLDPLHGASLTRLRQLREQLAALPANPSANPSGDAPAAERAVLAEAIAAALLATRPQPVVLLPWRWRLGLVGVVLAVAAVGYGWKGSVAGWNPAPAPNPAEAMVQRLAERLAAAPDGAQPGEWAMLGRSYSVLGRTSEAIAAYRQALQRGANAPESAGWRAELADLLATTQNGQLSGEPAQLLADALKADPRHPKALALAAAAAWQGGDPAGARALWQRLLQVTPPGDPLRASAEKALQQP